MAVEFVVEDGTGKSDATSYVSVVDFQQYWENRGIDYSALTDPQVQVLLNIAAQYLDDHMFISDIAVSGQALQFPRSSLVDRNGDTIANSEVPQAVIDAQCEYASYQKTLQLYRNDKTTGVSARTFGPISATYKNIGGSLKIRVRAAELKLAPFLKTLEIRRV